MKRAAPPPAPLPPRAIFGVPLLIALATIVGLVAALLDDGLYDAVSWAALLVPLLVIGWALRCRRS
ncbi:uncharacterized protein involved in exopolysaccharide biosynthesis [Azospirillum agricola]|uniref:hypothetical protein n=1 Tax=Azospirillum agricola TaxID=1720247 RepID=UPI001AEAEAF2|nr:hypothetical protein [Azospirillum agricola]MBP2232872.1 uncharacterized protein involved in exopolysaccharide biosynthesis [Azospirillum agricola]